MTGGLLVQSVIYLAAAVIVVPIMKYFKLSAVLGYLLAGIIIGPSVLQLVNNSKEEQESVLHFAEYGVVMMLFLIGLELRPALLLKMRTQILGLGGLQVLLTTLIITSISVALGTSVKTAIAIGMILSLSSTAIVLQSLKERDMLATPAGKNVFAVLLFQDIAVIPMLAIMPFLSTSQQKPVSSSVLAHYPAWVQFIAVIGVVIFIILVGRFLLRHCLRFIAKTETREVFTAFALFLIIAIALLMNAVGLSPALGTFLAGVLLAESEYRHQLELDLEPFKGLLLGLFFMSVGAGIHFSTLLEKPVTISSMIIGLIIIKFLVLFLLAKIFKMNFSKTMLFSCSLAQAGEFAFVLFSVASSQQILSNQLIAELTLVVALSMIATPIIMILYDKIIQIYSTKEEDKESDLIEHHTPIVIAGYGRFGQIVGRLLKANGFESTVLDFNSDHIETLRKFGSKVYYGDASRLDLLETAGIAKAKLIIITLANIEKSLALTKTLKKQYPKLKIFVRVINRQHAYELMELGVYTFERDTFHSSLQLGEKALISLGFHPYRAKRATAIFKNHDHNMLDKLYKVYKEDRKEYIESSKESERLIAQLLKADIAGDRGYQNDREFWQKSSKNKENKSDQD